MFNAARCNDARRYNAPTSPPGGRMPLVRSDPRADSNSIPLPPPSSPLPESTDRKVCPDLLGEKGRGTGSPRFAPVEAKDEEGKECFERGCFAWWCFDLSNFLFFYHHSFKKDSSIFERRSLFTSIHNYSPGIWNNCKVELIKEWKIYNVYLEIKLIKVMFMR